MWQEVDSETNSGYLFGIATNSNFTGIVPKPFVSGEATLNFQMSAFSYLIIRH